MKLIVFTLLTIASFACFSQTAYFSTDGNNRLTASEFGKVISKKKELWQKNTGQETNVFVNTTKTEKKKDSIINFVTIDMQIPGSLNEYVNKKLPEITLTDIDGKEFSINTLNGKPTLINFWFINCAACIDEMPVLNKIYDNYKDQYNFVAITYESKERVNSFLKKQPFKFHHIVNAKSLTDQLNLKSYPANLILDKNGIVKFSENGIPYEVHPGKEPQIGNGQSFIDKLAQLK